MASGKCMWHWKTISSLLLIPTWARIVHYHYSTSRENKWHTVKKEDWDEKRIGINKYINQQETLRYRREQKARDRAWMKIDFWVLFVLIKAALPQSSVFRKTSQKKCAIKTIIGLLFLFVCYGGSTKSGLKERRLTQPRYRRFMKLAPDARLICIFIYCCENLSL